MSNLTPTDGNAIAFPRSTGQVRNIAASSAGDTGRPEATRKPATSGIPRSSTTVVPATCALVTTAAAASAAIRVDLPVRAAR